MYIFYGIISIIFGVFMLLFSIKSWIKDGTFYGNVFKGVGAGIMGIILGIVLIVKFFSN